MTKPKNIEVRISVWTSRFALHSTPAVPVYEIICTSVRTTTQCSLGETIFFTGGEWHMEIGPCTSCQLKFVTIGTLAFNLLQQFHNHRSRIFWMQCILVRTCIITAMLFWKFLHYSKEFAWLISLLKTDSELSINDWTCVLFVQKRNFLKSEIVRYKLKLKIFLQKTIGPTKGLYL